MLRRCLAGTVGHLLKFGRDRPDKSCERCNRPMAGGRLRLIIDCRPVVAAGGVEGLNLRCRSNCKSQSVVKGAVKSVGNSRKKVEKRPSK